MYSKILFPADGSDNSAKAINYLLEVAAKFKSEVVLMHAYEVSDEATRIIAKFDSSLGQQLAEMETYMINYGQAILDNIKTELEKQGSTVTTVIRKGKAGQEIVRALEDEKCDLLIMGSRGKDILKSILIGSVSNYVIHHTHCPVILIH